MSKLYRLISIAAAAAAMTASGITVEQARQLTAQGRAAEAARALDSIAAAQPRNAEVRLALGEAHLALGDEDAAFEALTDAKHKGSNDANLPLADIALRQYRLDDAEKLLDDYRSFIARNRRKNLTDDSHDVAERLSRMRTMLDRVDAIVVVDSLVVPKADFFDAYRLSPESGRISAPSALPDGLVAAPASTVYTTEDGREMIWSAPSDDGAFTLMVTDRLNDGSWEAPRPLGDALSGIGNANYPFLMPDGTTLYFAADGDDSIGGYDIFITRDNGNGFMQPQNVGMPYNSPYDDYLLAIDEMTGAGWWATDRNQLGDNLTIYIFVPSDLRRNVPLDDPDIADRARLRSIAATQPEGFDPSDLRRRIAAITAAEPEAAEAFAFPLPDGRVITSLKQFSNRSAIDTARRWLAASKRLEDEKARLDALRSRYAAGDHSVGQAIIDAEKRLPLLRAELARIANDLVRAELPSKV